MFVPEFKKGESDLLVNMNRHQFEDLSWVKCDLVQFSYLIYSIKFVSFPFEFNPQVLSLLVV